MIALRAVIVSETIVDDGKGMILDDATRISPEEFQTMTSILVASKSSTIALSKLVFKVLGSGSF